MKIEIINENSLIRLSDLLKMKVSKKFYRRIKFLNIPIYVNGIVTPLYKEVKEGDKINFEIIDEKDIEWPLYESKIDIVYEDSNYLIINKRENLLSIPTKAEPKSVYQEALYYLKSTNQELNVSILNRLDKETSGLMVIAKNRIAANNLSPTHLKMERKYLCMVDGILEEKSGRIVNYIKRDNDSNKRIATNIEEADSKIAISNYRVIKEDLKNNTSILEFVLETGRTHQIRVHTSYLGHPIIGDKMYGKRTSDIMYLHSYYVKYYDEFKKEYTEVLVYPKWWNDEEKA